ncbi:MAG: hypothetical protein QFB87_04715 [Patescibacteria group bacterium]|nr:hypothetical protein [Patescibacteria group bacterium]
MTKHIAVTVPSTGEVLEFNAATAAEIKEGWLVASDYIKAYEKVKSRLKLVLEPFLDYKGQLEIDGYLFRQSIVQRMTYDKAYMREVFDEDTLDLLLKPSKTDTDKYLAEHLTELGEAASRLRENMIPDGRPYTTTRIEKLSQLGGLDGTN